MRPPLAAVGTADDSRHYARSFPPLSQGASAEPRTHGPAMPGIAVRR